MMTMKRKPRMTTKIKTFFQKDKILFVKVLLEKICPVDIEEEENRTKYRKFCTVIDLTDKFTTTEYVEEESSIVEVIDFSN